MGFDLLALDPLQKREEILPLGLGPGNSEERFGRLVDQHDAVFVVTDQNRIRGILEQGPVHLPAATELRPDCLLVFIRLLQLQVGLFQFAVALADLFVTVTE